MLEAAGNRVLTPDLPGHGTDTRPVQQISLGSYVERVVEILDAAAEPVTLVGHSSGGMVVAQATELRPGGVNRAVYLCAFLPSDGESILDLGGTDREGLIIPNLIVSDDGTTTTIREDVVREALFADCPEEDYRRPVARFRLSHLDRPRHLRPSRPKASAGFPGVYVECRRDRAISPELQRRMCTATLCTAVVSLDTGHSPQYSSPATLAARLRALVDVDPPVDAATVSTPHGPYE